MAAIIDYRGKTPRKTSHGVPLVTAKVVKSGRIETPTEFIDPAEFDTWMRRGLPEPGDVVITTEAPLGEVAQLGTARVALAQRLIALRGRPDVLDNAFLKFLLQSKGVQDQLRSRASGTTVLGIKQSELRKIELDLPPLTEQRAIAHILCTLDDKIDLNRQMSATLEQMARALFKSWFVDFDPVRAKAEGRETGLPKEIEDLFPDSFGDSDLGEIPKGWGVGVLCDIVELQREQVTPAASPEQVFNHFSLPAFDGGRRPVLEAGASIRSNKFIVPQGAVLLSKLNPSSERVWLVDVQSEDSAICSTEFLVLLPQPPFGSSFAYCLLRSPEFRQQLQELVTGTSNSHQRASWREILALQACAPTEPIATAFAGLTDSLFLQVANVRRASGATEALRDLLLPPLVSGVLADRLS